MDISAEPPRNAPLIVDYRANANLSSMQVSFHWWGAGQTSLRKHNHCEFFIITNGRTLHNLNGENSVLEAGALCFIRPQDVHRFTPIADVECIHINVSATVERLDALCSALGIGFDALCNAEAEPPHIQLAREDLTFFLQRARQAQNEQIG